ncbi:mechanosensitive ion channel family protein [Candidatus Woesebacteria bacterium]|nr:mechanosensitive ion channel family protein [Candidatus Woesebacteria bacterium]MCD8527129.1 mechanosensitive ion channel family protein [Candidatus Woesebacteria bacterium]MCD8546833.1 mechanosensitive ion channel family protein [Candidatus Woesebacteria bacterium]
MTVFTPLTPVLNQTYAGNTLQVYGIALLIVVFTLAAGEVLRWLLRQRFKGWAKLSPTKFDDTLIRINERITWPFFFVIGVYIAAQALVLPVLVSRAIWAVFLVAIVAYAIMAIQELLKYLFYDRLDDVSISGSRSAVHGLLVVVNYALWVLGFLLIASNLGMNVTSLIAGLGVGGVAVAFALQNILEDLFSSFAIYFDRPFEIGDFVVVGDKSGTVERVGIKTTRIRALQGEQIVFSNRELTTAQIQNFKKLEERRVEIHFGITYEATAKQREAVPEIVEAVLTKIAGVRFGRAHLSNLGESALIYEVVYFVEDPDYTVHMNFQQQFYLDLLNEFAKQKIALAYPTQTVWVKK